VTWRARAACKGKTWVMFPVCARDVRQALEVCRGCPVRAECREVGRGEPYGVWGGVSARERGFADPYMRRKRSA